MYIILELPFILILFLILGLIGIGVQIASTFVFWTFVITFVFYWITFAIGLASSSIVKDSLISIILSIVACISGFLVSLFLTKTFYRVDNGLKTLLAILIGLIIAQIAILLISFCTGSNKAVGFLCILLTFTLNIVCCMWTIGYRLSYPVKVQIGNAAYYECVEHKTKPGVMPYINRNIYNTYATDIRKISSEHIIGHYEIGDRLQPAHGAKYFEGHIWEIIYSDTWYSVYTEDGQIGWIPDREIKIYYNRESESIKNRQQEQLSKNWYGCLPNFFLEISVQFFEKHPHQFSCNFAE